MTTVNNLHICLLSVHVVEKLDLLVPLSIRYMYVLNSNSSIILCYVWNYKNKYDFNDLQLTGK